MKKALLLLSLALVVLGCKNKISEEDAFLHSLEGTYVELFTTQTCLNPKYTPLWNSEAAKFVGKDKAEEAIAQLVGGCQGTITGEEAVTEYSKTDAFKFCCSFKQGVSKITFKGNHISGVDKDGKELFSHKYHFVEKDSEDSYIYESDDNNIDEFRFFWMRPDSPSQTHHIEFRYGNDKAQLTQIMTGKYAFWMASAVREGHEDEYRNSIILFVGENLGGGEQQ